MKKKKEFPCADLLGEARLDGYDLIHDLSFITKSLHNAYIAGDYNNNEELCLREAKASKEAICTLINSLMKIRDKITFFQAWAEDNSPLN